MITKGRIRVLHNQTASKPLQLDKVMKTLTKKKNVKIITTDVDAEYTTIYYEVA